MRVLRVKFYKYEMSENSGRKYLGHVDVIDTSLKDGCSALAKAFRVCSDEQRLANSVEMVEVR